MNSENERIGEEMKEEFKIGEIVRHIGDGRKGKIVDLRPLWIWVKVDDRYNSEGWLRKNCIKVGEEEEKENVKEINDLPTNRSEEVIEERSGEEGSDG